MNLSELKKALNGVSIVQITPFNDDGSLDLEGMRFNTRWLLERTVGKDYVYAPLGSNGECYALSQEEWEAVVRMVVEEVGGRNKVIVGTGQPGTQETVKRCRFAQSAGADGALVVLPYYFVPQEEGMYLHYKTICESVDQDFGIVLYNNPGVSGSWVRPPLMAKLAQIPNFAAVKENTSSVVSFRLMQRALENTGTQVVCGRGEEIFQFVAPFGCTGLVSFMSNFMPEISYSVYLAAVAGKYDEVERLCQKPSPFFKDPEVLRTMPAGSSFTARMTAQHGPATGVSGGGGSMQAAELKAAMDMLGLRGGVVRLPLVGITKQEKEELRTILRGMGLDPSY